MTANKRIKSKVDANAVSVESTALLGLIADIRAAVGDPTGKLMQDELVERCRKLRADNELLRAANSDTKRIAEERDRMESALKKIATAELTGDWGQDLGCIRAIARIKLDWPNVSSSAATPGERSTDVR
jgi:hypothetical protein